MAATSHRHLDLGRALMTAVLLAGPRAALADPPYGTGYDAPDSFAAAVAIQPDIYYLGYDGGKGDGALDYYKFAVPEGADIEVFCSESFAGTDLNDHGATNEVTWQPCRAQLLDPSGDLRASPADLGYAFSFASAHAGDWRLCVNGHPWGGLGDTVVYEFLVHLTPPSNPATGVSGPRPGVTLGESGGSTSVVEGGAGDSYTVALSSPPRGDVTIAIQADGQVAASPSTLTFTAANFAVPQAVAVSAVDDDVAEGPHAATIRHASRSADPDYDGATIGDVTVHITDDDVASVAIAETDGGTHVVEGGAGDSYSVSLATRPAAAVTVGVDAGNRLAVSPAALTFTPENFAGARVVTVHAVDDDLAEGSRSVNIVHRVSSSDPAYDRLGVRTVAVAIDDDDDAGSSAGPPSGKAATGAGGALGAGLVAFGMLGVLCRALRRSRTPPC